MTDLTPHWHATWAALGLAEPPPALLDTLLRSYAEPQRKYHTQQHLGECLDQARDISAEAERPGEVLLALWFHDAIYQLGRHDNEQRSADWARQALRDAGGAPEAAARVHALVMATEHRATPLTGDAQVLVDVDLSILGAAPARFDEYERQVREEYAHVPGLLFRRKRREVLKGFLQRRRLYATDAWHDRLEAPARDNLRRSVANLGG